MIGTLDGDLRASAAARPEHTAVIARSKRLTYRELDERVEELARRLRALGVTRGDRVAVVMRSSGEAAVAIYAILRAGAAFVPLNPTAKEAKLRHLLAHCEAAAVMCDADVAERVRSVGAYVDALGHVLVSGAESWTVGAGADPGAPFGDILDVDMASIIYTSGSTGVPKGAVFLHRNMHFVSSSIIKYLGLHGDDRILCVLPLSHTYGLYQLIMSVRVGATLVLENGMTFPGQIVNALEQEQITVLPGVPTVWHVLVSLQGLAERELPHLRLLTNAGAALSAARVADVRRTFPHADLLSMYGQTECKRVCYLPADQIEARPDSVGFPIPGTEAWIENERGEVAGPGEVGELMIRGDHVMQGYWRDAEGTAAKLKPGRFPGDRLLCSGDLFRRDEDGYLYFVSRTDDIITSRGEKIAPGEVERVLYAIDGVREAAVMGAPDDRLGEAVIAHVSLAAGSALDEKVLRRLCAAALEDFMVPKRVVIHGELPKTDNGKLDRLTLMQVREQDAQAPVLR
ncbi:MAG: class I adenylate-forming enzyme family protein [Solirubrobacteraceae bacterium]